MEATTTTDRKARVWPWVALGLVCATGLGIFMWAVGGAWNLPAPAPDGPAATPEEAVEKLVAAVDRHDLEAAKAYCDPALVPEVEGWVDETGYLRCTDVQVQMGGWTKGRYVTWRAKLDYVTRFLDGDDPYGLNLAFLAFPEPVERDFAVVRAADGRWLVVGMGPLEH